MHFIDIVKIKSSRLLKNDCIYTGGVQLYYNREIMFCFNQNAFKCIHSNSTTHFVFLPSIFPPNMVLSP